MLKKTAIFIMALHVALHVNANEPKANKKPQKSVTKTTQKSTNKEKIESIAIDDFTTTVFSSKNNNPMNIKISLTLMGKNIKWQKHKIYDTLNIITSSFYAQNLLTSQGKENYKKSIIAYNKQKQNIHIKNIYIKKLHVENESIKIDKIIEALKKEGFCKPNPNMSSNPLLSPQPPAGNLNPNIMNQILNPNSNPNQNGAINPNTLLPILNNYNNIMK